MEGIQNGGISNNDIKPNVSKDFNFTIKKEPVVNDKENEESVPQAHAAATHNNHIPRNLIKVEQPDDSCVQSKEAASRKSHQDELNDLLKKDKEFLAKKAASLQARSTIKNENDKKPEILPVVFRPIILRTATSSDVSREQSNLKCQSCNHSESNADSEFVEIWKVNTTPSISCTIIDFDNSGVHWLYTQDFLSKFKQSLPLDKPESFASYQSWEASICRACVQWAEKMTKLPKEQWIRAPKEKTEPEKGKKAKSSIQKKARKEIKIKCDYTKMNSKQSMESSDDLWKRIEEETYELGEGDYLRCPICVKEISTTKEFRIHVEKTHRNEITGNKRSGSGSMCKSTGHSDIFQAYSLLNLEGLNFVMKFSEEDPQTVSALEFLQANNLASGDLPLCTFCVHFGNFQTMFHVKKTKQKIDIKLAKTQNETQAMSKPKDKLESKVVTTGSDTKTLGKPKPKLESKVILEFCGKPTINQSVTNIAPKRRASTTPFKVKKKHYDEEEDIIEKYLKPKQSSKENIYKKEYHTHRTTSHKTWSASTKGEYGVLWNLDCGIPGKRVKIKNVVVDVNNLSISSISSWDDI